LIEVQDSVLIVIDVQDLFLKKMEPAIATIVLERIRWLVQVAGWLMRAAGIAMVSSKGIFYEWMRDIKTVDQFSQSGIVPPADLALYPCATRFLLAVER
jgi:hypothetical protein